MKGVIFQLLEEVVTREHGSDTWDLMLKEAGTDGVYTSLGSYADAELLALVDAAAGMLAIEPNDVIRWFGRSALPLLAMRYPPFFTPHRDTRSFLLTLNDIIHTEVRKLYPGADVPVFDFDSSDPEVLRMRYRSTRRLCALAEGLIEGAAAHFRQSVAIEQPVCKLRGDGSCMLLCRFEPRDGNAINLG